MKAEIIKENGVAKLRINGEMISSVSFRSFWPQPGITRDFAQSGIRLMSVYPSGMLNSLGVPYSQFGEYWIGEGQYDWDVLRAQMDQFIANAPNAYFSLILQLDTREWYLKQHPECRDTFTNLPEGISYQPWHEAAKQCLRDTLSFLDREYPEKIYAVYICVGRTCEWYNSGRTEYDANKEARYREWSGNPQRVLPTMQELMNGPYGILYDKGNVVEYLHFLADLTADTIKELAAEVKSYNPGLLVGCFCGYTMAHEAAYSESCQNGLIEQVFGCKDIDMVFSPASYMLRGLDSVSNSHLPMASARLHGKMYYHEIDNTTYIANANPYAQVLQISAHRRHTSLAQSIHYARREAAVTFAQLGTYWWFDMFGGWYDDKKLQEELLKIGKAQERLYSENVKSNAEVAYFIDEESEMHIGRRNILHDRFGQRQMEELGRVGCQVDYYAASDILDERFDRSQYKLYIFPDMIAPTCEMRQVVAELRNKGASILFMFAPGLIKEGNFCPEAMEELTGIRLKVTDRKFGYTLTKKGEYNDFGMDKVFGGCMDEVGLFAEADEREEVVFGHGLVNGAQQFVVKRRNNGGFDAWIAQGMVPDCILRPLVKAAGCFQWVDNDIPVYTNSRMLALYSHNGGEVKVNIPWEKGKLEEMYTDESYVIDPQKPITMRFEKDECKCFLHCD